MASTRAFGLEILFMAIFYRISHKKLNKYAKETT